MSSRARTRWATGTSQPSILPVVPTPVRLSSSQAAKQPKQPKVRRIHCLCPALYLTKKGVANVVAWLVRHPNKVYIHHVVRH